MTNVAHDVLDREFLEIRSRLLDLAACFDRLDRASGSVAEDSRMRTIQAALRLLAGTGAQRAQQIQLLFSQPYETDWQASYAMDVPPTCGPR